MAHVLYCIEQIYDLYQGCMYRNLTLNIHEYKVEYSQQTFANTNIVYYGITAKLW